MSPGLLLWVKAFHVIAVISWMAGILYLPRLFVYHSTVEPGTQASETFKVMESKLLRFIMNPAMVVSWVLGLFLAYLLSPGLGGWFHLKLLLVLGLSGFHGFLAASCRAYANDLRPRSERFWRLANEIPTVLMIVAVIMVIVKPF